MTNSESVIMATEIQVETRVINMAGNWKLIHIAILISNCILLYGDLIKLVVFFPAD